MMAFLHIFLVAALTATALAACTDDSDCSGTTCNHGEHPVCKILHGSGQGAGEKGCACVHHKRQERATVVCAAPADCDAWGKTNCGHGEKVGCELNHGAGSGQGELNCVCKSHRRAAACQCTQASDCDATALGCDPHKEKATCELVHGSGHGCGENVCKCVSKH